jgi:hypothetical protein
MTFCFIDSNTRALLVEFGFITVYNDEVLYQTFKMFLNMHDRPLTTFNFTRNESIQLVYDFSFKKLFVGAIVYRIGDILEQLAKGLYGDEIIVVDGVETFRKLACATIKL